MSGENVRRTVARLVERNVAAARVTAAASRPGMPERRFGGWEIERHPERLVGLVVTLVGKEAIRWEHTTITAVDGPDLVLAGGEQVTGIFTCSPVRKPIVGRAARVPRWEVARGVVEGRAEGWAES